MRTSLPVNHQLKVFFILVDAHNDLFDGGAEDHLLKCRGTVVALPDPSKVIAHRTYSDFLFTRSAAAAISARTLRGRDHPLTGASPSLPALRPPPADHRNVPAGLPPS